MKMNGTDLKRIARRRKLESSADDVLAQELNELSVPERESIYEEVHGVAKILEETPELISKSLHEFDEELSKVPKLKRKIYDRAVFLKPSIEKDLSFKLMFLRVDRYDATKAVKRMCRYFVNKLELFGQDKLVVKITLGDLDEDDLAAVNTGSFQVLPQQDQSGRTVWFSDFRKFKYKSWRNQTRYLWYQAMNDLENEYVQIKGVVDIFYCVGMTSTPTGIPELTSKGAPMLNELPIRMVGMHFCYSSPKVRTAMVLLQMVIRRQHRLHFRAHCGSDLEIQYALMTFGIRLSDSLLESENSRHRKAIEDCIEARHLEERSQADQYEEAGVILYPKRKDVLLGRGRPFQDYVGNLDMIKLVDANRVRYYQTTDKLEKTVISMEIVKTIQELGGRFLQRNVDAWEIVDDITARGKVSQAMRTKVKQLAVKPMETQSTHIGPTAAKRLRLAEDIDMDFGLV